MLGEGIVDVENGWYRATNNVGARRGQSQELYSYTGEWLASLIAISKGTIFVTPLTIETPCSFRIGKSTNLTRDGNAV